MNANGAQPLTGTRGVPARGPAPQTPAVRP